MKLRGTEKVYQGAITRRPSIDDFDADLFIRHRGFLRGSRSWPLTVRYHVGERSAGKKFSSHDVKRYNALGGVSSARRHQYRTTFSHIRCRTNASHPPSLPPIPISYAESTLQGDKLIER
jgi:hypothetical protein